MFPQALHFFIGLGALVSPLVADPFLADDSCVLGLNGTSNSSWDLEHLRNTLAGKGVSIHNTSQYHLFTEGIVVTKVSYAFWIMAVINVSVQSLMKAQFQRSKFGVLDFKSLIKVPKMLLEPSIYLHTHV